MSECLLALPLGLWLCPCSHKQVASSLNLTVNNQNFALSPEDYFAEAPIKLGNRKGPLCVLEVMATADDLPFLLGDTFLRKVIAVFDAKNKRVALAKRKSGKAEIVAKDEALAHSESLSKSLASGHGSLAGPALTVFF